MPDIVNSSVFDEAIAEVRRRSQLKIYQTDFDAWNWDVLRMRDYAKIREIAYDTLFAAKERTLTKSGNGVGKSSLMARMVLWAGSVFPVGDTVSIISAPSIPQLQKVVFAYLKNYHGRVNKDVTLKDFQIPGHIDENLGWVSEGPNGKLWLASGRKPPDQDAVSMFQGLRSLVGMTYVWFDEAGGMSKAMFTAAEAVMTGGDSRFAGIGNPDNATADWMANFTRPENMAEYNLHTISVFDTPVFTGERVYPRTTEGNRMEKQLLKALTSKRWVAHKSRIWATGGEILPDPDHLEDRRFDMRVDKAVPFDKHNLEHIGRPLITRGGKKMIVTEPMKWDARGLSKVMGEFPGDADFAFFPQELITKATDTNIIEDQNVPAVLGVDIARFGTDESVVYINRGGRLRLIDSWAKESTVFSAKRVNALAKEHGVKEVRIDAAGVGGGVYDYLNEEFQDRQYALIGIDGGTRSTDIRRWANFRAESHDNLRTLIAAGDIDIDYDDEELREQMGNLTFKFTNRGGIQITPKDEMKTEMNGSPDRMDAAIYASLDASPLYPNPDGIEPGDVILRDPYEMAGFAGKPWWADSML